MSDWDIPYVTIHNVVARGGRPIIIQMSAMHEGVNYAIMLRGSSVDLLTVLTCEGRRYVAQVTQMRPAVGKFVRSNAAGMIDAGETPEQAAKREGAEELGGLTFGEIIDLNALAFGVEAPMVVSPGANDETVFFFAQEVAVTLEQLAELQGGQTGLAVENERIVTGYAPIEMSLLELIPRLATIEDSVPDLKLVTSVLLYCTFVGDSG